ncbi:DUF6266 family protein [Marinilabilia sp.]|uniref:DUF6266 family protein n=1 Tax=Marinilabilia sp. TaxID=2021252 RepID=UPI0025BBEB7E|nr:DUF6266 family protein [Marinilabilia sp.]
MAQFKQGLTGTGKGMIGNLIMYEMFGKTYVRSRPTSYKDRKSLKQLIQRQKITLTHNLLRHLSPLLRITMKNISTGRSAYHTAVSINMKEAIDGIFPDQYIHPHKVVFSKGDLTPPTRVNTQRTDKGIFLEWSTDNNSEGLNSSSDKLIWCMKDLENTFFSDFEITSVNRKEGQYLLPKRMTPEHGHVWIMFRSADEMKISDTKWAGHL